MADSPERALDAPFRHPDEYPPPIPGTCSRCGQPALLGETRWWHIGAVCAARGRKAQFIPEEA